MTEQMKKTRSTESGRPQAGRKKIYKKPELIEWGSIIDLTQGGPFSGVDADFPKGTVGG